MPPHTTNKLGSHIPNQFTFANAHDIQKSIRATQDPTLLSKALSALRHKLSLRPGEMVTPHDERLTLARLWMESSPAAQDLFNIWGAVNDMSIQASVSLLLSSLLSLLSFHLPDHSFGIPIIKTILSPQWRRRLNSHISGSHNEQILSALKLFNTISLFGSGRERKSVLEAFPWDNKCLPKLLHMRRKGKGGEGNNILARPDIRTYYILFILSMIDKDTSTSIKAVFLEQHRQVFMSMFKGFVQDHYDFIQKVLQVCWEGIWLDPKLKRTTKLGLFNEATISHLLKLYDRVDAEQPGGSHVPADIIHHFLLALCTHPGQGICFRDRGWYPREADEGDLLDQDDFWNTRQKGASTGKLHNRILANILRTLKVNEDPRQQELALKIISACPELVAGYWSAASLTLEPRCSSKWIANISFAGQILSQPVPLSSFFLSGSSELYNPTPPPLSVVIANIFPSVSTRPLFTKGLQTTATPIVQHCTALMLSKSLQKLSEVVRVFMMVGTALEEDDEDGQWGRQRREVEKEARRRVPEFQVIIAFSQQPIASSNPTAHALLSESSQRLLWLYQECLPEVVAEARFEVGKLILNLVEGSLSSLSGAEQDYQRQETSTPLQTVKHLHVLRLLSGSDQFAWSGKVASSSHTYLYVLLRTYCTSRVRALCTTLKNLLLHVLSESVLFQEDPTEVAKWLAALPSHTLSRGQDTETPDGALLADEVDAVATFLDDCTQRCLKTPYRYMDAMSDLSQSSTAHQGESFASPLLMTLLEQLLAKLGGKLMNPSDALAVFTFVRRLLVLLAAKQGDPRYCNLLTVLDRLDASVVSGPPFPDHPSINFGIRRELSIGRACLRHFQDDCHRHAVKEQGEGTIATFLDRIEQMPIPTSENVRITNAFELVDWLRLANVNPTSSDISRLTAVIHRLHEPAIWALITFLHPSEGHLWVTGIFKFVEGRPPIDDAFGWLYFHCTLLQLRDQKVRGVLLRLLPVSLISYREATLLITHGIAVSESRHDLLAAQFSLLSDVFARARSYLSENDVRVLKAIIIQSDAVYGLCVSQDLALEVCGAIQYLISTSFDPADIKDQVLLLSVSSHWSKTMSSSLASGRYGELKYVQPWIKFMGTEQLLATMDLVQASLSHSALHDILEDILGTLQSRTPRDALTEVPVSKLLELKSVLPESTLLEDMLSKALVSQLPGGLDGRISFNEGEALSDFFSITTTNWSGLPSLPLDLSRQLLEKESWTDSTGSTHVALLYSDPATLQPFVTWLNSKRWIRLRVSEFNPVLAAFLECAGLPGGGVLQAVDDLVIQALLNFLFVDERSRGSSSTQHLECIHRILELSDCSERAQLAGILQKRIDGVPLKDFAFETTFLARKLLGVTGYAELTTNIVDRTLQWAVRLVSGDDTESEDSKLALENLKTVAMQQKTLKPHLVEPLLVTLIQHRLSDAAMIDLAVVLVKKTALKPVVVNRFLQNILQHSHFVPVCGRRGSLTQRNQVTRLLEVLFRLAPGNTCQPTHIEALFQVYGGTMSSPDRRLLSMMRLFEAEKKTSLSPLFSLWSPTPDTDVSSALEVIQNFDPVYMLRACLSFPSWRRFGVERNAKDGVADSSMYDPLMVIVLSAQMLAECPPTTPLGWVKVFRSNVVGLLIRCLSSKDPNMRETALCQIASIWEKLQKSDMHETHQVLYLFRMLKNVISPPAGVGEPPQRLPTFTTLILLHALRGIFYPSNFIYPHTARFLLQRPELDVSDVPMLFGMLYSNSDDWKKERGWMLRMLGDGMASTDDWKVLKRRHTWDLLASLFQSSKNENAVRTSILEILGNLTCNSQACASLLLKSSLLSWIEMQVGDCSPKESIAWLRILENVLVMADTVKLTHATGEQWCSTICRCISSLLQSKDTDIAILRQSAAVLLRLSHIPGVPGRSISGVLAHAVQRLRSFEPGVHLHRPPPVELLDPIVLPPHRAQGLHVIPATTAPLLAWGEIVETLWRTAMSLDNATHEWTMLTRRLLVWRALVGEEVSQVGEWARKEVVRVMHDH